MSFPEPSLVLRIGTGAGAYRRVMTLAVMSAAASGPTWLTITEFSQARGCDLQICRGRLLDPRTKGRLIPFRYGGRMPAEPSSSRTGRVSRDPEPHQRRQVAESFGADAERYDRARPSYPGALVERIVAASPGSEVLDVGCGTGIAARQFQAAGSRVLGVDPDARMAELARQGGIDVEVTKFEAWDPAGREFDAVIAGQAWHWVDPAAGGGQSWAGTAPRRAARRVLERVPASARRG